MAYGERKSDSPLEFDLDQILFLDIETVPLVWDYDTLTEALKPHWRRRFGANAEKWKLEPADEGLAFQRHAGVFSEFAKVVCVSFGAFSPKPKPEPAPITITSYCHTEESKLLRELGEMLKRAHPGKIGDERTPSRIKRLCGHNGKEFDFPFLARRMLIHGIELPPLLQTQGLKPWEVPFFDTMELWKFGDYKSHTSLALLCDLLGLASPKESLSGDRVGPTYYEENDLEKIRHYCEQDVLAVARVFQRLRYQAPITDDLVTFKPPTQ
jgi:3'-5' exonuclease